MSSSRNPISFLKKKRQDRKDKKAAESRDHAQDHAITPPIQNEPPVPIRVQELPPEQPKEDTSQYDRERQEAAEAERLIAEQQRIRREEPWRLARPLDTISKGETFAAAEERKKRASQEQRKVEKEKLKKERDERSQTAFKGLVGEQAPSSSQVPQEVKLMGWGERSDEEVALEKASREREKKLAELAESEARRKIIERIEEKRAVKAPVVVEPVKPRARMSSWKDDGAGLSEVLVDAVEKKAKEAKEAQRAKETKEAQDANKAKAAQKAKAPAEKEANQRQSSNISVESEAKKDPMESTAVVIPVEEIIAIPTGVENGNGDTRPPKNEGSPINSSSQELPLASPEPQPEPAQPPKTKQNSHLEAAIDIVRNAIEADSAGDYQKALDLYRQSLERFMIAIKYEANYRSKEIMRAKAGEYMERAEKLQRFLYPQPANQNKWQAGNGERADSGGDAERLRKAVDEVMIEDHEIAKWKDVVHVSDVTKFMEESIIFKIKFPHLFMGARRMHWDGLLLHGPSGCGKSHLVRGVATEAGCTMFTVNCSTLVSVPIGNIDGIVERIFVLASQRRPAILFFDQVDELHFRDGYTAEQVKKRVLVNMRGIQSDSRGVFVFASTNRPWVLPPDILDAFQKKIYLGLPDLRTRTKLFETQLKSTTSAISPEDYKEFGRLSDGYSRSDIDDVIQAAHFEPLKRVQSAEHFKKDLSNGAEKYVPCAVGDEGALSMSWTDIDPGMILEPPLKAKDIIRAFSRSRPSVSVADARRYDEWANVVGQET